MCWEIRANEGLAITHAFYTTPGFDRRVLSDATVAQIFMPYETRPQPRYHDVAYGLGLALQPLDAAVELPRRRVLGRRARVPGDGGPRPGRAPLRRRTVHRTARAGARAVGQQPDRRLQLRGDWAFDDDGAIEPAVALAGVLQFGDIPHLHNIYWRLDVDIDDPGGDRVEEFYRIAPAWSDGRVGAIGWTPLLGETYRADDLATFRKWRIADANGKNAGGRSWSYDLVPSPGSGSLRTTAAEGFSRGEFWVTRARSDERFVSGEDADYLSTYIDGEAIDGQDVVVWYARHAHHEVRSEDRPHMPVEWVGFELRPRDYFDQNPLD